MGTNDHDDLPALRSRVAALAERESALLAEALTLSRTADSRNKVDALFAQAQSIQVERSALKKQIAQLLGTRRLHLGSEVWQTGTYDYAPPDGGAHVRVRVSLGPLGMHAEMPGGTTVRLEMLRGTFDGPFGAEA